MRLCCAVLALLECALLEATVARRECDWERGYAPTPMRGVIDYGHGQRPNANEPGSTVRVHTALLMPDAVVQWRAWGPGLVAVLQSRRLCHNVSHVVAVLLVDGTANIANFTQPAAL